MAVEKLVAALEAVDWNKNVATFLKDGGATKSLADANLRVAMWARQFEIVDKGNPALCFVREMQIASQHVSALTAVALYKAAAASMRAMLETALYYTYFRTHPVELATLIRVPSFYVEKKDILQFHKDHTVNFADLQQKLGVISRMETWYGKVSSIIHGQIPGAWVEHKSLADIKNNTTTQATVVSTFIDGEEIVHRLLLCTVGQLFWDNFSSVAKKALLRGLHGDLKDVLKLDIG